MWKLDRAIRQELRALVKEERQRQSKAVDEVVNGAQVRALVGRWDGSGGCRGLKWEIFEWVGHKSSLLGSALEFSSSVSLECYGRKS